MPNAGLGFWTFEPGVLVSYLGQKNGFEFTTYLGYDINTENTETSYQSEQVFHIDATVAQHLPLDKGLIGSARTVFTCSKPPATAAVVPGAGFSTETAPELGQGNPSSPRNKRRR